MPLPKAKQPYIFQDSLTWPENQRWEIIDGIAYDMKPAPNPEHQSVLIELIWSISPADLSNVFC